MDCNTCWQFSEGFSNRIFSSREIFIRNLLRDFLLLQIFIFSLIVYIMVDSRRGKHTFYYYSGFWNKEIWQCFLGCYVEGIFLRNIKGINRDQSWSVATLLPRPPVCRLVVTLLVATLTAPARASSGFWLVYRLWYHTLVESVNSRFVCLFAKFFIISSRCALYLTLSILTVQRFSKLSHQHLSPT